MRAAVLVELNKPLQILSVEPCELKVGQVLVKVLVSGLCGSQLHELNGNKGNEKFLPHLLGHEGCGIVKAIGPGVTNLEIGDKVVMHWRQGRGIDSEFPLYSLNGKRFSSGKINTLTELAIVSENRLTKISKDVNSEIAALMGCSLTTAFGIIENETKLKFGESVLVLGCGGVGLNLINAARRRGAGRIVGFDVNPNKSRLALAQGAIAFYSSTDQINGPYDLIIDTTGSAEIVAIAFENLSKSGRLKLVGQPAPHLNFILPNALRFFDGDGLDISASQGGKVMPSIDIPRYLKQIEFGGFDLDNLITHRFKLDEINEAIELLKSGDAGRIMVEI
jgi:Zn-dependent alcohol dehydrogenase